MTLFLCLTVIGTAQHINGDDDIFEYDEQMVRNFVDAIRRGDRNEIADYFQFPLGREYPIPAIHDRESFLLRFDQLFDAELIRRISISGPQSDWSPVGWRGVIFENGTIWMSYDGSIIAVNYQTDVEERVLRSLIENQKKNLHPDLRIFSRPILIATTHNYRIRIDMDEQSKFRYAAWGKDASISEAPDLILEDGEKVFDGSGGSHNYQFSNGNYLYRLDIYAIGNHETRLGVLTVKQGDEVVLSETITSFQH